MHNEKIIRRFLIAVIALLAITFPAFLPHAEESTSPALAVQGTADQQALVDPLLQSEFDTAKVTMRGFAVESAAEYKRIKDYHNSLVGDEAVVHSFTNQDGDFLVCVDIFRQPSLRDAGLGKSAATLEPTTLPGEDKSAPRALAPQARALPGSQWLDGSLDESGSLRKCPADTYPKLAPRLETLVRHKTLEDFYRKTPVDNQTTDGKLSGPLAVAPVHEYAHAYKNVNSIGQGADFNIWQPYTEKSTEFSLSQLWCVRGSGSALQTVELGWQVYAAKYGNYRPRLFIYFTTNGYTATGNYKGCYNLDCKGFVQTNSSIVVGSTLSPVSKVGGTQYTSTLDAWRDPGTGHWWIRYNGAWLGYYPTTLYASSGLKPYSARIDFGGEIIDDKIGGHTATDMGSGYFPQAGFRKAAFTKKIHYWNTANKYYNATGLIRGVTNSYYYDLILYNYATDANWKVSFYFGGPGR
ncbi:MAG: neprosin family prolyl endopeptidase [Syntrophobacteraceae bacterium]